MKAYISPAIDIQAIRQASVLCSSGAAGDRVGSNVGVGGGDDSASPTAAF